MLVPERLNTITRWSNNHLFEISCKNIVLAHEIRGTNFWDTLCTLFSLKYIPELKPDVFLG